MAQDDRFDLARLERRLQALEDASAIRKPEGRVGTRRRSVQLATACSLRWHRRTT